MRKAVLVPMLALTALAGCGGGAQPPANATGDAANTAVAADANAIDANAVEANATDAAAGNAAANATDAANPVQRVLAMSERERNAVFIRAILDAGMKCEGVTKSERLPDKDGLPVWRAACGSDSAHVITITPDGTANIVSRTAP